MVEYTKFAHTAGILKYDFSISMKGYNTAWVVTPPRVIHTVPSLLHNSCTGIMIPVERREKEKGACLVIEPEIPVIRMVSPNYSQFKFWDTYTPCCP